MIAQRLSGIGEIVRIHADAVAAHQARLEAQRIPLGVHARQHLIRVDSHAVTDHGHLVHKGDVDVPLAVLHHLHGLGGLNGGHGEGAGLDDDVIYLLNFAGGLLVHAGNDLADIGEGVYPIAGVDALGAVADLPVHAALEAGLLLDDGHANVLGDAGVHRGLEDHDGAGGQVLPHGAGGALHRTQVGGGVGVHGRGHGHNDELGLLQPRGVGGEVHGGVLDGLAHLVGGVDAVGVLIHALFIDVEADDEDMLGKLHGNGHTHIAQAHQGQLLRTLDKAIVNGIKLHMFYSFFNLFTIPESTFLDFPKSGGALWRSCRSPSRRRGRSS